MESGLTAMCMCVLVELVQYPAAEDDINAAMCMCVLSELV